MKRLVIFAITCAACGSSSPETQPAELGGVQYSAPGTWQQKVINEPSRTVARWTPEQNPNKESISVIRSSLPRGLTERAPDFTRMLLDAQRELHGKVDTPETIQTKQGLTAIVLDVDFKPPGMSQTYHRVHALVRDGETVINVLYTARTPDPDLQMFHQVLDSVRHEEG